MLRHPWTYLPDNIRGRMLAGMGVPDLRDGLGTSTFYTADEYAHARASENVVHVRADGRGTITTHLVGPWNPKTRSDLHWSMTLHLEPAAKKLPCAPMARQPRSKFVKGSGAIGSKSALNSCSYNPFVAWCASTSYA